MKHPTQHAEQIDVLTRALSIAAQQTAGNDAAKACGLVDLWILMASAQYVAELKQQAGETTTCAH